MVGASGFEPPTSRSRTVRSTRLSHAPTGFEVCNFKLELDSRVASYDCQTDRRNCNPQIAQITQLKQTSQLLALDEGSNNRHDLLGVLSAATLFLSQLRDVSPDPPGNHQSAHDANDEVKAMKQSLERFVFVPLFAEFLAHI